MASLLRIRLQPSLKDSETPDYRESLLFLIEQYQQENQVLQRQVIDLLQGNGYRQYKLGEEING